MARRLLFAGLGVLSLVIGWIHDRPVRSQPLVLGGYQVLAADFHTHSSLFSNGALTPWGLVLEARREGLDVLAITGHGTVFDAKLGRWLAGNAGGPMVIVGEEVQTLSSHLVAAGIETWISGRLPVSEQIAAAHRQGGVAIAAHPLRKFWPGFDEGAITTLDGTEVCHPDIYTSAAASDDFERFGERAGKTAIGSSDYHGLGRIGACRTYVFCAERTARSVLEAVRLGRTVVYGAGGKAYGDPNLIALAETQPALRQSAGPLIETALSQWVGFLAGLAALAGLTFLSGPRRLDTSNPSPVSNQS